MNFQEKLFETTADLRSRAAALATVVERVSRPAARGPRHIPRRAHAADVGGIRLALIHDVGAVADGGPRALDVRPEAGHPFPRERQGPV